MSTEEHTEAVSERVVVGAVQISFALIAAVAIAYWLSLRPAVIVAPRIAGMDGREKIERRLRSSGAGRVEIGAHFEAFDGVPSVLPGVWPSFRGPNLDGISTEDVPLSVSWGEDGPPCLWSIDLGEGHGGAAVRNGRVYLLDYDEERRADALRCLSLADGREIWRRWYDVHVKRNHGMSRTVPTVTEKYVLTIGPKCHVMCVRSETGDLLWGMDMVEDYGTRIPGWYAGQCPLIEGDVAILAPSGTNVLMIGVSCESGEVLWQTLNPKRLKMSHASIVPMAVGDKRMYIYAGVGGIVGVSAEGADRGEIIWETTAWTPSVIAPSPVSLGDGRVFVTAGYGAGGMMFRVVGNASGYDVEVLYHHKPKNGFASEQQTPVYYQGHLFGIMPKDGGAHRKQLVCYRPDGELAWSSGKPNRFGIGPLMVADGKLLILDDDGVLTVAKASTTGYEQLAQARVLQGVDSWAPPALIGGKLLVRDSKRMICLDISGE